MESNLNFYSCLYNNRYYKTFRLPDFLRNEQGNFSQEKTLEIIIKEEYGEVNDIDVNCFVKDITDKNAPQEYDYLFCGKCKHSVVEFTFEKNGTVAAFKVDVIAPIKEKNPIFAVMADFKSGLPTKYCPVEELLDCGIGIAHVYYNDITTDDGDFDSGIAKLFCDRNNRYAPGKLALWAYAMKKIGQYLIDARFTTCGRLYSAGHSRLGKTALLACAQYDIFAGCFVNCSGCCGAAISRDKAGESIEVITNVFPYWFTENFKKYAKKEYEMPFDQHFLMAAVAPRKVFIVAASEDFWADTEAQYVCAEAATVAYNELGYTGLIKRDTVLGHGEKNDGGEIAFYIRKGPHFFSREDWNFYINCAKRTI